MTHARRNALITVLLLAVQSIVGAETYGPDNLPPFVHPPVMEPVPDGIKLAVPKELGNQVLARLGFVDVTAAPFRADPTGRHDSTEALQRAIEFARDAQLVCFFPSGTYTVSNTLVLRHGIHMRSHRATFMNNNNMPCVLIGSRRGTGRPGYSRPKIVLRDRSPGFDNPKKTKYVIQHQVYDVERFTVKGLIAGGSGTLMNTLFINIDIVIGPGNPGATGMHIRSCEGSAVQDVTIDATHGHTGIEGSSGNGGSWANLTIIGGRIGIDMTRMPATPPTPTMEGITLLNQTEAAIISASRGPLTAVGLKITSQIPGPVIVTSRRGSAFDAGLNLIDSEIRFDWKALKGQKATAIAAERSVYLNNVYVQGADEVVAGSLPGHSQGWLHVKEFALGKVSSPFKGYEISAPVYIDGRKIAGAYRVTQESVAPPEDIQSRHLWEAGFPGWESPDAVCVTAPPYNAIGDSYADDTDAIQRAVDEHEIVFVPKGYYRLTRPLRLKPDTKLIGVAQHLSVLMVRDPEGPFGDSANPQPVVQTSDGAAAETVIAFLGIRFPFEVSSSFPGAAVPVYSLKWQCGPKSFFRSCDVNPLRVYGFIGSNTHKKLPMKHPSVLISGHGGGKWYNYHAGHMFLDTTLDAPAILIRRTSAPLHFYNFEPQGGDGDSIAEIRDARNVSIYGCKTECDNTFLRVVDCDHIRVFGHGGIGNPKPGDSLYVFERTPNFLISIIADQVQWKQDRIYSGRIVDRNIRDYFPLLDMRGAAKATPLSYLERPVLYKQGEPRRSDYLLNSTDSRKASFSLVGLLHDDLALDRPHDVEIQENIAYVPGKGGSLAIIDVSDVTKPKLLSSLVGVEGLEDAETVLPMGDVLLLGTRDFLAVDVSDPARPKILKRISDRPRIDSINGMALRGDHVLTANKSGYVTVFDVSDPSDPVLTGVLDTKEHGGLRAPHDVAVFGDHIIVVSAGNSSDLFSPHTDLAVYRVADSKTHRFLPLEEWTVEAVVEASGKLRDSLSGANRVAITYDHRYATVGAFVHSRVGIIDIRNPRKLQPTANMPVGDIDATGMTISGKALFVAGGECVEAIDITDPADPVSIAQYRGGRLFPTRRLVFNGTPRYDNGHDLVYRDGYLYVTAQNDNQFGILKINDRETLELAEQSD